MVRNEHPHILQENRQFSDEYERIVIDLQSIGQLYPSVNDQGYSRGLTLAQMMKS